jgi:EAL domain-containing protein (putative c-di-GMP-specific phosphodiesterase class I)
MADVEGTQVALAQLAVLRVRLAIDDFGTGYSSLAYLSRLSVDELNKIDRSFARHLTSAPADATIVAATTGLGHMLGLSVVTEGVEDAATYALLGQMGCDVAQGYFLARPLPADAVETWLRQSAINAQRTSA